MQREALEKMIESGRDSAMLRLTLGRLLLEEGDHAQAVVHLRAAVAQDAGYTAAWKELGRAEAQRGSDSEAMAAWRQGVDVARRNGDKQAEKEMTVFLKRLERKRSGG